MSQIAENAVVDPRAELGPDVEIGPFCLVGPHVTIGRGTRLQSHVTLLGRVTLGEDNQLFPGVVVGAVPQDRSTGEPDTQVILGDRNVLREGVVINRATDAEAGITTVGHNCFLMSGSQLAHDVRLGNHVTLGRGTLLGHGVHVHNFVTLSDGVVVAPLATLGAGSAVNSPGELSQDVPPYVLVEGVPLRPRGVHTALLEGHGFRPDEITAITEAFRLVFRAQAGLDHAREFLRSNGHLIPVVNHFLTFLQQQHEGRQGRSRERRRAA